MATPATMAFCTMCDNVGTMVCSGCKSIHYCSKACQKIDWPIHKIICKDYTTFITTRPDQDHHSAIIFHPHEPKPRFLWLRFECGHNRPSVDHLAQLGMDKDRIEEGAVDELSYSPMLKRHIRDHHIVIFTSEDEHLCLCCNTDFKSNNSLTDADQELTTIFRGTVLVFGKHCEMDVEKKPHDLDLGSLDFREVIDHLRKLYCGVEDKNRVMLEGKGTRAVRLNCLGDTTFLNRPGFESVIGSKLFLRKSPRFLCLSPIRLVYQSPCAKFRLRCSGVMCVNLVA